MVKSPFESYQELVKSGVIAGDRAQARATEALETLAQALRGYRPARRKTILTRILGGESRAAPHGLYIHGGVGRGKSMLMDLFFRGMPLRHKRRVHFNAFMVETHQRIHEWRTLTPKERARRPEYIKNAGDDPIPPVAKRIRDEAWLLCFDEFQVGDVADAMILGRLFAQLFAQGVVVVMTSNTAPEYLYEGGINRQLFLPFIALIRDTLTVVRLETERDYRLSGLAGVNVYLSPLGEQADAAMNEFWRNLSGGVDGVSHTLSVQGRKFIVPRVARGVARFTFEELCRHPRAAADYLALARDFHTVLIDRIPVIPPEDRNEARRLTLLIDTLYDEKVKLVCSAAAAPHELHVAGDSAAAFKRTASRLVEMQSAAYLREQRDDRPSANRAGAQWPERSQ